MVLHGHCEHLACETPRPSACQPHTSQLKDDSIDCPSNACLSDEASLIQTQLAIHKHRGLDDPPTVSAIHQVELANADDLIGSSIDHVGLKHENTLTIDIIRQAMLGDLEFVLFDTAISGWPGKVSELQEDHHFFSTSCGLIIIVSFSILVCAIVFSCIYYEIMHVEMQTTELSKRDARFDVIRLVLTCGVSFHHISTYFSSLLDAKPFVLFQNATSVWLMATFALVSGLFQSHLSYSSVVRVFCCTIIADISATVMLDIILLLTPVALPAKVVIFNGSLWYLPALFLWHVLVTPLFHGAAWIHKHWMVAKVVPFSIVFVLVYLVRSWLPIHSYFYKDHDSGIGVINEAVDNTLAFALFYAFGHVMSLGQ